MLRSCLVVKLTPQLSFFTRFPRPSLTCCKFSYGSSCVCYYNASLNTKWMLNKNFCYDFLVGQMSHLSTSSQAVASLSECCEGTTSVVSKKAKRKALHESPEGILRRKLNECSKGGDMVEALKLYDEARSNGVVLNVQHFNMLLYLCASPASVETDDKSDESTLNLGLERGFEIFQQMFVDEVSPNEATFTSAARLAAARDDPEMAFELIKRMKSCSIAPKLRSYDPALFGFCKRGDADKAYEVDADMIASGIMAEEPELAALLKLSVDTKKEDKVYEMLHRLRATVRQVSESTLQIIEDWFKSEGAAKVGEKNWDVSMVRKGILQGGGGWHGQGWLGSGRWKVVKTHVNDAGMCLSCSEKLVSIDIDPKETENFAKSLRKLACEREAKASFNRFQEWLQEHGPFDAVVDGANVSLVNSQHFSFSQLNHVVQQLQQISPSKRLPLVILHISRVTSRVAQKPNNKRLLDYWKKNGALYATPQGSNDDWYWLYAAVSCKGLLVTNDEMRDHLFQLLGSSFFPRWKEKHQVRLSTSTSRSSLIMPPPYSTVIQFEPETSSAMGFGFRCGFLGLLHMEIVQERLEREYNLSLITTAPSVVYSVNCVNGDTVECSNPSLLPEPGQRKSIEEPFVKIEMLTPKDYIGPLMELAQDRRGQFKEMKFITENRSSIIYELPLAEMVGDFFDQLKSRSKGYASMEYTLIGYRESDLVRLDIQINGDPVEPLATIVHRDKAYSVGRALTQKLKELIPRQMFKVPIQACIGSKVIASEALSAIRKDVLAKCYGGDISRKKKLLKKQAEGKKRMKSIGKVDVPQEAFMAVLKLEKEVI